MWEGPVIARAILKFNRPDDRQYRCLFLCRPGLGRAGFAGPVTAGRFLDVADRGVAELRWDERTTPLE